MRVSAHVLSRRQRRHTCKSWYPSSPLDIVASDVEWGDQKTVGMDFLRKRNCLWTIRNVVLKRFFASKISRLPKLCRLSKNRLILLKIV